MAAPPPRPLGLDDVQVHDLARLPGYARLRPLLRALAERDRSSTGVIGLGEDERLVVEELARAVNESVESVTGVGKERVQLRFAAPLRGILAGPTAHEDAADVPQELNLTALKAGEEQQQQQPVISSFRAVVLVPARPSFAEPSRPLAQLSISVNNCFVADIGPPSEGLVVIIRSDCDTISLNSAFDYSDFKFFSCFLWATLLDDRVLVLKPCGPSLSYSDCFMVRATDIAPFCPFATTVEVPVASLSVDASAQDLGLFARAMQGSKINEDEACVLLNVCQKLGTPRDVAFSRHAACLGAPPTKLGNQNDSPAQSLSVCAAENVTFFDSAEEAEKFVKLSVLINKGFVPFTCFVVVRAQWCHSEDYERWGGELERQHLRRAVPVAAFLGSRNHLAFVQSICGKIGLNPWSLPAWRTRLKEAPGPRAKIGGNGDNEKLEILTNVFEFPIPDWSKVAGHVEMEEGVDASRARRIDANASVGALVNLELRVVPRDGLDMDGRHLDRFVQRSCFNWESCNPLKMLMYGFGDDESTPVYHGGNSDEGNAVDEAAEISKPENCDDDDGDDDGSNIDDDDVGDDHGSNIDDDNDDDDDDDDVVDEAGGDDAEISEPENSQDDDVVDVAGGDDAEISEPENSLDDDDDAVGEAGGDDAEISEPENNDVDNGSNSDEDDVIDGEVKSEGSLSGSETDSTTTKRVQVCEEEEVDDGEDAMFHRGASPLSENGLPTHAVLFSRSEAKRALSHFRELRILEASMQRAEALVTKRPELLLQAEQVPKTKDEYDSDDEHAPQKKKSSLRNQGDKKQPVVTHHIWYTGSADVVCVWGVFHAPFKTN